MQFPKSSRGLLLLGYCQLCSKVTKSATLKYTARQVLHLCNHFKSSVCQSRTFPLRPFTLHKMCSHCAISWLIRSKDIAYFQKYYLYLAIISQNLYIDAFHVFVYLIIFVQTSDLSCHSGLYVQSSANKYFKKMAPLQLKSKQKQKLDTGHFSIYIIFHSWFFII